MTRRPDSAAQPDWIGALYDQFAGVLYRYALMLLADPAGAADVVQSVFLRLTGRPPRSIRCDEAYLRRAIRNECYSALRRRRREPEGGHPLLEPIVNEASVEERLSIERAIRRLPPEQREVLHLKVYEGRTLQEIADLLDESINTVASRYRYAIDKLRAELATSKR